MTSARDVISWIMENYAYFDDPRLDKLVYEIMERFNILLEIEDQDWDDAVENMRKLYG